MIPYVASVLAAYFLGAAVHAIAAEKRSRKAAHPERADRRNARETV